MKSIVVPMRIAMGSSSKDHPDAYEANARKNREWSAKLEKLTTSLEKEFAAATKAFKSPPQTTCVVVANALIAVGNRKDIAPLRRHPNQKPRLAACKSAVALLHHLEPLRQTLADRVSENEDLLLSSEPPALVLLYKERLDLLDAAVKSVEALVPALREPPIAPWPDGKPVQFIAQRAQEAWAEANGGKAPRGRNPDDPLVKFVVKALSLIGINKAPSTVSARLKGLR